jgi:hypothetical protein
MQEAEEALICGMFQQLGELLCVYYFRNEYRLIHKKIDTGSSPAQAVQHTLGISYATLGAALQAWSFPERIVSSLEPYPPGPVPATTTMPPDCACWATWPRTHPAPDQPGRKHRACTATPGSLCARLALEINSLHAVIAETQAEFAVRCMNGAMKRTCTARPST